jgi:hypothetical protein
MALLHYISMHAHGVRSLFTWEASKYRNQSAVVVKLCPAIYTQIHGLVIGDMKSLLVMTYLKVLGSAELTSHASCVDSQHHPEKAFGVIMHFTAVLMGARHACLMR